MKKLFFTNFRTNVLCNRLFLLLCCIITATAAKGSNNHHAQLTANIDNKSQGMGKVYVSQSNEDFSSITGWNTSSSKKVEKDESEEISYAFYAYAKPEAGYFFVNWTGDVSDTDTSNKLFREGKVAKDADSWDKIVTANFRSIVENIDKIRLYYDPVTGVVEDGELTVRVNSSTSMTVTSLNPAFTVTSNA